MAVAVPTKTDLKLIRQDQFISSAYDQKLVSWQRIPATEAPIGMRAIYPNATESAAIEVVHH
jgi:hypothetical protein